MAVDFKSSRTKENLMKAFAGESQARNRYTFAAGKAKQAGLPAIEQVFRFTAHQEKEHAEIFYNHLKEFTGENIEITGTYPVETYDDVLHLLRAAQHDEYQEHEDVYEEFEKVAREEGFEQIAGSFFMIKNIEKVHGDRFGEFAGRLEDGTLFRSEERALWMCLNCGFIYEGTEVPEECPTCQHEKGYFVRLSLAPFTEDKKVTVKL